MDLGQRRYGRLAVADLTLSVELAVTVALTAHIVGARVPVANDEAQSQHSSCPHPLRQLSRVLSTYVQRYISTREVGL